MSYFDSVSNNLSEPIFCYYTNNNSRQIQVIRIINIPNWYFERVVFPGQRLIFEAVPSAQLEIYTNAINGITSKVIPCERLRVTEESTSPKSSVPALSAEFAH